MSASLAASAWRLDSRYRAASSNLGGCRAIRKATERCEECVVIWQARVELNEIETT